MAPKIVPLQPWLCILVRGLYTQVHMDIYFMQMFVRTLKIRRLYEILMLHESDTRNAYRMC